MTEDGRTENRMTPAAPILADLLQAGENRGVLRSSEDPLAAEPSLHGGPSRSNVVDRALITSGQPGQTRWCGPGPCRLFRGLRLSAYSEAGRSLTIR